MKVPESPHDLPEGAGEPIVVGALRGIQIDVDHDVVKRGEEGSSEVGNRELEHGFAE
jgi:hypothetical protein